MNDFEITSLYQKLLDCWNRRDAGCFASLFTKDAFVIGFDGSQMDGQHEIETELKKIFADHVTSAYIGKVKAVHFLSPEITILEAIVGMVPPGGTDPNPATNAIQVMVAVYKGNGWLITSFQNTPAAYHGRPDLVEKHTIEIRELLHQYSLKD